MPVEEQVVAEEGDSSIECYHYRKLGHYQYECPNLEEKVNYVEFDEDEDILLIAYTEEDNTGREVWFLDSGCSNHMSGHRVGSLSWMRKLRSL